MTVSVLAWAEPVRLATAVWPVLLGATVRGGVLILFAAAALGIWTRASAAKRYVVWMVVCGSLMLLPVLQMVVPAWRVRIPPALTAASDAFVGRVCMMHVPALEAALASHAPSAGATAQPPSSAFWIVLLVGVWGGGVLTLLALLLSKEWRMRRFIATAAPLSTPHILAVFAEAARILQISGRRVSVLEHPVAQPMVYGLWRPVIVLPVSARTWEAHRLRHVLLHELAHIQRYDNLTQTVAAVTATLYWYNPLVWLAARALRTQQERACDDVVLAAGSNSRAYATDLLDLMQAFKSAGVTSLAAMPFARPAQMQTRVQAIIDRTQNRHKMSRRGTATVWSVGFAVIYPLVGFTPQATAPRLLSTRERASHLASVSRRVASVAQTAIKPHVPSQLPRHSRKHQEKNEVAPTTALVSLSAQFLAVTPVNNQTHQGAGTKTSDRESCPEAVPGAAVSTALPSEGATSGVARENMGVILTLVKKDTLLVVLVHLPKRY